MTLDPATVGPEVIARAVSAARLAQARAYAPYSGFQVGAALLGADGSLFTGCNVENAAYPESLCAERGAVMAAVCAGVREFSLLVIATAASQPTPPCGGCRQVLAEFGTELEVLSVSASGERRWQLRSLLPDPFGGQQLRDRG